MLSSIITSKGFGTLANRWFKIIVLKKEDLKGNEIKLFGTSKKV